MTEYKLKEWFIMKIYIIEGIDDINKYLDDVIDIMEREDAADDQP